MTTARVTHISPKTGDIHLTITGSINGDMTFLSDGSVSPGTELSPAGLLDDDGYALAVWALAASVGDEIDIGACRQFASKPTTQEKMP